MAKIINMPDGVFLVTGPTGSGRDHALRVLERYQQARPQDHHRRDPVEYQLNGINQVQVNADINLTFAAALRSSFARRRTSS